MRPVAKLIFRVVGLGLTFIGLGGIPAALDQWEKWLTEWGPVVVNQDLLRWGFVVVGLSLIAAPWVKEHRKAVPSLPKSAEPQVAPSIPTPISEPEKEADDQPRVFVGPGVTPNYLFELFEGKTDIQAQRVADPFVGMWITVSGRLSDVGHWSGFSSQVTLEKKPFSERERSSDFGDLYLMFRDESWVEKLSVLAPGDPITVRGRIERVQRTNIQIEECELVDT